MTDGGSFMLEGAVAQPAGSLHSASAARRGWIPAEQPPAVPSGTIASDDRAGVLQLVAAPVGGGRQAWPEQSDVTLTERSLFRRRWRQRGEPRRWRDGSQPRRGENDAQRPGPLKSWPPADRDGRVLLSLGSSAAHGSFYGSIGFVRHGLP